MLRFSVNAKSVQESNIFLRKLWSELNLVKPMGWNMYPYKSGTTVTIGTSTLGEISFDYKRRGGIKNISSLGFSAPRTKRQSNVMDCRFIMVHQGQSASCKPMQTAI